MAVFKVFFRTFMTFFLGLVLLVNLMMFATLVSGTHPLGLGVTGSWDFNHYYFGFSSIINAFRNFNHNVRFTDFLATSQDLNNFIWNTAVPLNHIGDWDIVGWLQFIGNILTFPIWTTYYAMRFLINFVGSVVGLLIWLSQLFGGYYNIPLPNV